MHPSTQIQNRSLLRCKIALGTGKDRWGLDFCGRAYTGDQAYICYTPLLEILIIYVKDRSSVSKTLLGELLTGVCHPQRICFQCSNNSRKQCLLSPALREPHSYFKDFSKFWYKGPYSIWLHSLFSSFTYVPPPWEEPAHYRLQRLCEYFEHFDFEKTLELHLCPTHHLQCRFGAG